MELAEIVAADSIAQSTRWRRLLKPGISPTSIKPEVFSSDLIILPEYVIWVSEVGGSSPDVMDMMHVSRATTNGVPRSNNRDTIDNSFGAALSRNEARVKAVMETIELRCTARPFQRTYKGSYLQFEHFAIHPPTLLLFSVEEVSRPDFPFCPYSDELEMEWVWGYDITEDSSVLVPVDCVFSRANSVRQLVRVDSTGGSAHASMTKAILHGLYEVIERDALMITWLTGLGGTRVDLVSVENELATLLTKLAEQISGEVVVLDVTSEVSIPTIMAVLYSSRLPLGLAVGTGANIDSVKAVERAALEIFVSCKYQLSEGLTSSQRSLEQEEGWSQWLGFLANQERLPTSCDLFVRDSIQNELTACVEILKRIGFRIIAVDCTAPDLSGLGVYCTKIVVPYMQPRFLDDSSPKRLGNPRLRQVPRLFGHDVKPEIEFNSLLHPFL